MAVGAVRRTASKALGAWEVPKAAGSVEPAVRTASGISAAARPPEDAPVETVSMDAARQALGLGPRELELAVELGEVEVVATPGPLRRGCRSRRIPATELTRLRTEEGFPATLRERTRLVGAGEGAELLGIARTRFARLARAGCFGPVRFSLNRYRAVVWAYRAAELRDVAEHRPGLLHGPLPEEVRRPVERGEDRRPRHWRNRRIAQAARHTNDPWAAAAAHAAVLAPDVLAEAVPDPAERARLEESRPDLTTVRPDSLAGRRIVRGLLTADGEEEVLWHRLCLTLALDTARSARPLSPSAGTEGAGRPHPTFRNSPSCTTEAISCPCRS